MQAEDYHVIYQLLQVDCRRAIQEFAESQENREVYAFCIYCDPDNADYHVVSAQ